MRNSISTYYTSRKKYRSSYSYSEFSYLVFGGSPEYKRKESEYYTSTGNVSDKGVLQFLSIKPIKMIHSHNHIIINDV